MTSRRARNGDDSYFRGWTTLASSLGLLLEWKKSANRTITTLQENALLQEMQNLHKI